MAANYKKNDLKRLKKVELYEIAKESANENQLRSKKKADLVDIILSTNTTSDIPGSSSFEFNFDDHNLRYGNFSQTDIVSLPNISFSDIYSYITGYCLSFVIF